MTVEADPVAGDTASAAAPVAATVGPGGCEPPRWLRVAAFGLGSAVLAFGAVGLFLALNGWYRPALAFVLGGAVWIALLALAQPALGPAPVPASRNAQVYAAVGVAAIVAITAWNYTNASQHVLIDRDGGSYANTGRWIAREGSLDVKARVGPFAQEPTVGFESLAVYEVRGGLLQFQFAHLLPALLAEAHAVAGDPGLFHLPGLLGGVALLAFFVLAWRLFRRPLFALSAMLALGLIIPEVSFSRDTYSEIPSQILLFTALWLLVNRSVLPRWRVALVAGLFLGALEATRIDAIVFLIGLPVVCAVAWLHSDAVDRRSTVLPSIVALAAGIVPGLALGWIDTARHSGGYYADLSVDVHLLTKAALASVVVSLLAVGVWRFVYPWLRRLPWNSISAAVAVIVTLAGLAVWALRPRLQHLHGDGGAIVGLEQAEHMTVDVTRLYFERSLSWMGWYLGPLTLAVAIVGAGLLCAALLRGRALRTLAALAILVPCTGMYLYRARAVPDHVWVTRRFLVNAFPTLVLLALGAAAYATAVRAPARWSRSLRVGGVVVAVAAVAYPVYTLVDVRSMSEETGYLAVVKDVCADVGPHAAVVVLEVARTDSLDDWIPQALRGWCGSEVAVTRGVASPEVLHRLSREWAAAGRQFFVASSSADYVRQVVPDARITPTRTVVNDRILAPTLSHRPDHYGSQSLSLVVASIPASGSP